MGSHALWVTIAVIGIILLIIGGVGSAVHFLLWVGGIVIIVAIILFILRLVRGAARG